MALQKNDLDALDRGIILDLQEDARRSFKTIAARLDVSESTISNRVKRLKENGILKLEARVNPFNLPYKVAAVIGMNLERREHERVVTELEKIPEVTSVWIATGKYDLFVEVMADSIDKLNEFLFNSGLSRVKDVKFTETFVILASKTKYFKLY